MLEEGVVEASLTSLPEGGCPVVFEWICASWRAPNVVRKVRRVPKGSCAQASRLREGGEGEGEGDAYSHDSDSDAEDQ